MKSFLKLVVAPDSLMKQGIHVSGSSALFLHIGIYSFAFIVNALLIIIFYSKDVGFLGTILRLSQVGIAAAVFWIMMISVSTFFIGLEKSWIKNAKILLRSLLPYNFWSNFVTTVISIPTILIGNTVMESILGTTMSNNAESVTQASFLMIILGCISLIISLVGLFVQLFGVYRLYSSTKNIYSLLYKPLNQVNVNVKILITIVLSLVVTFIFSFIFNLVAGLF